MAEYEYHIVRASRVGSILSIDGNTNETAEISEYANVLGKMGFECTHVTPVTTSDSNGHIHTNLQYVFRRQR